MAKSNTWLRKLGAWTKKTFGNLWNKITADDLTNAEKKTMDYNAEQAQINRDFQSAEAEKARQWQENYYQQYESPQARIRQYEEAGLNPALLYGSQLGSGSAPSTSVPSGDSASAGMPSSGESLLSFIGQMMSLKSIISKNNAEANLANANAAEAGQRIKWNPQRWSAEISKNNASADNMLAGVELIQSQIGQIAKNIELTDAQIDKIIAETDNTIVDTAKKELEKEGVELNNRLIAEKIVQTAAETRLTQAQTYLTNMQGKSVSLQNFQQEVRNQQTASTGFADAKTWPEVLVNVTSQIGTRVDKGLRSLWNKIF